jgi:hypothetical protein
MIEFDRLGHHEEETWSTISGSVARSRWNVNTVQMNLLQQDEETMANSSKKYYGVLQDKSDSEETRVRKMKVRYRKRKRKRARLILPSVRSTVGHTQKTKAKEKMMTLSDWQI